MHSMFARVPSKSIYANIIKNRRGESLPPGVLPGVELYTLQLSALHSALHRHTLSALCVGNGKPNNVKRRRTKI